MKRIFVNVVILSLLFANFIFAIDLIKIAVLDWSKVSSNYQELQDRYNELYSKKTSVENVIKKEKEEIEKLEKELNYGVSESEKAKRIKVITQKKEELENFQNEAAKLLKEREDKIIEVAKENINNAIKEIASKEGISIVLSKSVVLYMLDDSLDITNEVIKILNRK